MPTPKGRAIAKAKQEGNIPGNPRSEAVSKARDKKRKRV